MQNSLHCITIRLCLAKEKKNERKDDERKENEWIFIFYKYVWMKEIEEELFSLIVCVKKWKERKR